MEKIYFPQFVSFFLRNHGHFSFSGSKFFCFSTLSRKASLLLRTSSASEGVDPVGVSSGRRVPSLRPRSSRIEPGILERRAALCGGAEDGSYRDEGGAKREEGGPAEGGGGAYLEAEE